MGHKNLEPNKKIKVKIVKKKKISFKLIMIFIAFEFIFTAVTGPFMLYYGPFNNVKKSMIAAIMQTRTHQYFATAFLSDKKINDILDRDTSNLSSWTSVSSEEQHTDDIEIPKKHDDSIIRYNIKGKKFENAYLLEIKDPTRVRVAITKKLGKEGQRTSQMAKDNQAVAAINGGGFTDKSADGTLWAGTGAYPTGVVISNGQVLYNDLAETTKASVMAIDKEGLLIVGEKSLGDLKQLGVKEALSFGPPLIVNGKVQKGLDPGPNPRTAIGQKKDGSILMLVIDGRKGVKLGASLQDVQEILVQYGAWNAINLDGGSSSTMYYEGEVINDPSDPLGERAIATSVYVEK
jgi:exopolysaccharide biosynthesis protein